MLLKKILLLGTISASIAFTACKDDEDEVLDNLNQADREFVNNASMNNMAEISLGELAQSNGSNDSVKTYASMMVTDHSMAQDELDSLASSLNVDQADSLNASMKALRDRLAGLTGYDFDTAYINSQVAAHTMAISQFENQ
ncbi:MAG TPA: DUF4142 domain-containing protein, partial [Emticicia sp.]